MRPGLAKVSCAALLLKARKCVVADINGEAAQKLANELGDAASVIIADVTRDADVSAMVKAAVDFGGGLDILVNQCRHGAHTPRPMEDLSEEEFDRLYEVNIKPVYRTALAVLPIMKKSGGAILNMASTAGVSPRPNLTWYNASKGWVITATRSMAIELAPSGVRVNALNPVAGETPMLKTFMGEDTARGTREVFVDDPDRSLFHTRGHGRRRRIPLFRRRLDDYRRYARS